MFCISLTGAQVNQVAGNNIISNTQIYYSSVTTTNEKFSNLISLVNDKESFSIRLKSPNWMKTDFSIGSESW